MKKDSGMVRRIDKLGRVVLPAEMKRELGLANEQKVEFYFTGDSIVIKKYQDHCVFCNSEENLISYNTKDKEGNFHETVICKSCIKEIINL